jgi:hypothetical protein
MTDVQTLTDLRAIARESAAFLIGVQTGRRLEHQWIDDAGRMRHKKPERPAPALEPGTLRLRLADDDHPATGTSSGGSPQP